MNVLVTGATGFIGRHVVRSLWEAGHSVRVYVRPRSNAGHLVTYGVEIIRGELWERPGLERAFRYSDSVVHLVGVIADRKGATLEQVIAGGARAVVEGAKAAGVKKFLHMSALGTRPGAPSRYHRAKLAAEEAVRASGIPFTIFRPSIVFGPGERFFSENLAGTARVLPVIPVPGSGENRFQPVAVGDVARAFVRALEGTENLGKTYELGGPRSYSMNDLWKLVLDALGMRRRIVHVPPALLVPAAFLMERLSSKPLVTLDQLRMVGENNACDPAPAREAFGLVLEPLEPQIPSLVGAVRAEPPARKAA